MCEKITITDRQHRNVVAIMATKQECLVTKDELQVALATVSVIISSPGMAFKILSFVWPAAL